MQGDPNEIWWDPATFKRDLVRSGDIWGDPSEIWWDPATFEEIQARSRPYLVRSGEIRGDPGWFRRFLVQIYWVFADSGEFFEDSDDVCRIRRLSQPTEPTRTPPDPKTDSTEWRRRSVSGPSASHLTHGGSGPGWVQNRPARPVDSPTWKRYNRTTEMNFTNRQDLNKLNLHPKKKKVYLRVHLWITYLVEIKFFLLKVW